MTDPVRYVAGIKAAAKAISAERRLVRRAAPPLPKRFSRAKRKVLRRQAVRRESLRLAYEHVYHAYTRALDRYYRPAFEYVVYRNHALLRCMSADPIVTQPTHATFKATSTERNPGHRYEFVIDEVQDHPAVHEDDVFHDPQG